MTDLTRIIGDEATLSLAGLPEGLDALVIRDTAKLAGPRPCVVLARDDERLAALTAALEFIGEVRILRFPAWDCLPYDRASPHPAVVAERMATLYELATEQDRDSPGGPLILLTTVAAAMQRVPTADSLLARTRRLEPRGRVIFDELQETLNAGGYSRVGQVAEPGEYAVRGGLIDIFPPGAELPVRIDFFGDEIDQIRAFDPLDQRTRSRRKWLTVIPATEYPLDAKAIAEFRRRYRETFGALTGDDPLFEAISAGRRYPGAEHWSPLFTAKMAVLADYLPEALWFVDYQAEEAVKAYRESIADYFDARKSHVARPAFAEAPYNPLPAEALYLSEAEWSSQLARYPLRHLTTFRAPEGPDVVDFGGKKGRDFRAERADRKRNIYDALKSHIESLHKAGVTCAILCNSKGSRSRLAVVLEDHGISPTAIVENWKDLEALGAGTLGLAILPLTAGFQTDALALITEEDLLGDRLVRRTRTARRGSDFLREASSLAAGDIVVHVNHGIGRFEGLEQVRVNSAVHDCLKLVYRDGDRLFLPVENIEMLSRYGAAGTEVELDKLGGVGWQTRHARLKKRIREIADELIRVAAKRAMRPGEAISRPSGLYEEFASGFPYTETEDQARAIDAVLEDLSSGRPMDRLICGDVGFGKTEVALRSAFVAAMNGMQTAVVAPTTLLARQHFETFSKRFAGLPVKIGHLSRLVKPSDAKRYKEGAASGDLDILIGTHAILSKSIKFKRLGLLIVDEEQHFGVTHKERLKAMKAEVHVLTLTATPIPRTLQMALTGIRDLSLIASPPMDRLAVRTFVVPFDELVVREALLREHYRGGQSYYVCPRIADLDEAARFLREAVPEVRFATAHGRMAPREIEAVMSKFYEGGFDVLLSTSIIESGLDIPDVNTLIVHRADRFGLSQLYQIRGRVGRSKIRAYAYLTYPADRQLTDAAYKRLEVLQALDYLGAGFSIASHDLDIRGAGNLLGEEQSGHIREVGAELYQKMLEEAVTAARTGEAGESVAEDSWSPQINLGINVIIPSSYVADVGLRMGLYRRLGGLEDVEEIDSFAAELVDRFGELPEDVANLLRLTEIKLVCLRAGIEKIEAGPKGLTLAFHNDSFADPAGLVGYISGLSTTAKLRPDHTLVIRRHWQGPDDRLKGALETARRLAEIATTATESAA